VVHDLPGVGKNFQDHMDVYLTAETAPVSYNGEDRWDKAARHGIQYLLYKTGPVTACVAEAGAFVSSSPDVRSPDIQIHCLPAYVVDHGRIRVKGHGVTINTCNLRPKSIGSVTLRSADPLAEPAIDPAFLQDPYDWKISMEAFERGREILNAPAFKDLIRKEAMPGADVKSADGIRAYIKEWSKTDYHPVGSCKMGSDDAAVVDTQLRVHGLSGLRVIDASIMPTLISGNTSAPSIMIGEKGAAIMRAGASFERAAPIRWGLLGASDIAETRMIPAMRRLGHDVVAVASGTPTGRHVRRPQRHPGVRLGRRVIARDDIDASTSAAPTSTTVRRRSSRPPRASTSCARSRSRCRSRTAGDARGLRAAGVTWRPTTTCPARAPSRRSGAGRRRAVGACWRSGLPRGHAPGRLPGLAAGQQGGRRRRARHHLP
jgi:hypothetical protein